MAAIFPAHLQDRVLTGSWSEKRRSHFSEFVTESGASIRSKFPGSGLTECQAALVLTTEEVDDLTAFYASDCAEGATSFYMECPRRKANRVFQWAEPPSFTHNSGDLHSVTLSLTME